MKKNNGGIILLFEKQRYLNILNIVCEFLTLDNLICISNLNSFFFQYIKLSRELKLWRDIKEYISYDKQLCLTKISESIAERSAKPKLFNYFCVFSLLKNYLAQQICFDNDMINEIDENQEYYSVLFSNLHFSPTIRKFVFSGVNFAVAFALINPVLVNMSQITEYDFFNCKEMKDSIEDLYAMISKSKIIHKIFFYSGFDSSNLLYILTKLISEGKLQFTTHFTVGHINLSFGFLTIVSEFLSHQANSLQVLNLSGNHLGKDEAEAIKFFTVLKTMKILRKISLDCNEFSAECLVNVREIFSSSENRITSLTFQDNNYQLTDVIKYFSNTSAMQIKKKFEFSFKEKSNRYIYHISNNGRKLILYDYSTSEKLDNVENIKDLEINHLEFCCSDVDKQLGVKLFFSLLFDHREIYKITINGNYEMDINHIIDGICPHIRHVINVFILSNVRISRNTIPSLVKLFRFISCEKFKILNCENECYGFDLLSHEINKLYQNAYQHFSLKYLVFENCIASKNTFNTIKKDLENILTLDIL